MRNIRLDVSRETINKKDNIKRKLQQQVRRFLFTTNACTLISQYIGCTKEKFIDYICKQLQSDMNIENYGKLWDLDHIVPVELFDLSKESELNTCYNYNNIMPLYRRHNKMKGGSIHFSYELLKKRLEKDPFNLPVIILIKRVEEVMKEWEIYF